MKSEFELKEILNIGGARSEQLMRNFHLKNKTYTVVDIMNSPITVMHKQAFVYNCCNLTRCEKRDLSIILGKSVASIYKKKYPNDNRVDECWDAISKFTIGEITEDQLIDKRKQAYKAAYEASRNFDFYDMDKDGQSCYFQALSIANEAAIAAADSAIYCSFFAYDDAAARSAIAATASDQAYNGTYSKKLIQLIIDFCRSIK